MAVTSKGVIPLSHLHIPDGLLPLSWIVAGFLAAAVGLLLATWRLRRADRGWLVPRLGVMSALMLLAMTVELGVIDYHVNLTVLAGVLLGPAGGFLAAFIANVFSAFLGHGGLTVVGLNATLNGLEAVCGAALFGVGRRLWPGRLGLAAGAATLPTLAFTTTLRLLVLRFSGVFSEVAAHGHDVDRLAAGASFHRFALLAYGVGAIGWAIETVLVAGIVSFLAKARPTMLQSRSE